VAGRLNSTRALVLVGLIFSGSLVLALVIPGLALWAVSQLGQGKRESFMLGSMACPLAVIGWAAVLGRLNLAYKDVTGRRDDDVLATCLTVAIMAAIIVFVVLLLLGGPDQSNFGPIPG
jgi:hypothetical protein